MFLILYTVSPFFVPWVPSYFNFHASKSHEYLPFFDRPVCFHSMPWRWREWRVEPVMHCIKSPKMALQLCSWPVEPARWRIWPMAGQSHVDPTHRRGWNINGNSFKKKNHHQRNRMMIVEFEICVQRKKREQAMDPKPCNLIVLCSFTATNINLFTIWKLHHITNANQLPFSWVVVATPNTHLSRVFWK